MRLKMTYACVKEISHATHNTDVSVCMYVYKHIYILLINSEIFL